MHPGITVSDSFRPTLTRVKRAHIFDWRRECPTGSSGSMPASSGPRSRCTDAESGPAETWRPGRCQGNARSSAQGSMTAIPQCWKSVPLRVATAASLARAMAAIWQSASRIGRPTERREAAIAA